MRKKEKKALYFIYQSVDKVIFERISTSTSAKEAWDTLHTSYHGEDKVNLVKLQTLPCDFDNLKMKESESVEDFYNRVIALVNQMRLNGEVVETRRIVEKILRSLPRKFEYIVVAIEESKDLSTLSLESLLGSLHFHELRMKQFDTSSIEHAFQSQVSIRGGSRDRGRESIFSMEEEEVVELNMRITLKVKEVNLLFEEEEEEEEEEGLYRKYNAIIVRNLAILPNFAEKAC